jgi:cytochrome c
MTTVPIGRLRATLLALLFGLSLCGQALGADAAAAQALARRSNCFKCHAIDKPKEAAPWKEVAAKNKGKPDAQDKLIKHITTGPKVKLEDGSQEEHPIIKTKNADEIKNLVDWILTM